MSSTQDLPLSQTGKELVSEHAFKVRLINHPK
jgi:hypothetical protein